MSQYLNRYLIAITSKNSKDGDYVETVFCHSCNNDKIFVYNKNKKEYILPYSSIKMVCAEPKPNIKFPIGTNVKYIYEYHWKDGEYTTFGKIVSYQTFNNDVCYSIQNLKNNSITEYDASSVIEFAYLQKPKYAVNQYVGVITAYRQHYLSDDVIENATILSVKPDFTKVEYSVKLDSGKIMTIEEYSIRNPIPPPKTPEQIRSDEKKFLKDEEARLIQQLEYVRSRMKQS